MYGAVTVAAADGGAYPGVPYDAEQILLYSEIDPVFHATVAANDYGPGKSMTSTVGYEPKYFLVNGMPYAPGTAPLPDVTLGDTVLLRLLNLGLQAHSISFQNIWVEVVAEDGNPLPQSRQKYSAYMPAGKTKDVVFSADTAGTYPIYDRLMNLTNDGADTPGGMLSMLPVVTP